MMSPKRGTVAGYLAVCGMAAGLALVAVGQPGGKSEKQPPARQAPSTPADAQTQTPEWGDTRANAGPLISVEFPGGTVAEYIDALRSAATPDPVNAVVSEPASKVRLAPVRLRKVALETAVQSIETAAGDAGNWRISRVRMERRDRDPLVGESPVFSVLFEPRRVRSDSDAMRSPEPEKSIIQVISLRDVTDPKPGDPAGVQLVQKAETVLTAVRSAIELGTEEGVASPEIKYHQDSGLLIVRGTPEQVGLVQQTIGALEGDVRQRRASAQQSGMMSVADLRAQMEKASLVVMKHEAEFRRALGSWERLKQQVAAGATSTEEAADAEARVQSAEIDMKMAQVEVARLEERLRGIEEQNAAPAGPAGSRSLAYDLSAWGPKGGQAGSMLATTLQQASASVGPGQSAAAVLGKDGTVIVTGEPWAQELARRVLGEYARSNGLSFDGAGRQADPPAAADPARGGGKKK